MWMVIASVSASAGRSCAAIPARVYAMEWWPAPSVIACSIVSRRARIIVATVWFSSRAFLSSTANPRSRANPTAIAGSD